MDILDGIWSAIDKIFLFIDKTSEFFENAYNKGWGGYLIAGFIFIGLLLIIYVLFMMPK